MSRRKGERPILARLDHYSPTHPVAQMIASGDRWFGAWAMQKATPHVKLAKQTGIRPTRLMAIDQGDNLSRAELDALACAWGVSAGDLLASMPIAGLVVE